MEMKKIGVVGSGTMGGAIAHQAAMTSFDVVLCDVEQQFLERAIGRMEKWMSRAIDKGKMNAKEKEEVIKKVTTTTSIKDFNGL